MQVALTCARRFHRRGRYRGRHHRDCHLRGMVIGWALLVLIALWLVLVAGVFCVAAGGRLPALTI